MTDFAANTVTSGYFAPQRFEADVYDCEVIGKIPTDINGAFVRVGGDWLYPSNHKDDSPFHQDGYVSSFRFKNGKVDYKGRWIKTEHYLNNKKAGKHFTAITAIRSPTISVCAIRASPHATRWPIRPRWRTPANCLPPRKTGCPMS